MMTVGDEVELVDIDIGIWTTWLLNHEHVGRTFENGEIVLYIKSYDGQMRRVQRVFVQLDDEIGDEHCLTQKKRNQT